MEPDQNNKFQRKIEPINEEAILKELASTQPAVPPTPVASPQTDSPVDPASVSLGQDLQLDPIIPVRAQPHPINQQRTPSTGAIPPLPSSQLNEIKQTSSGEFYRPNRGMWLRAAIVGAIVSVVLIITLHLVSQMIISAVDSSVQSTISSGATSLANVNLSMLYAIPYLALFITIIVGLVILNFVNLAYRRLYFATMLLLALGLFAILFTVLGQYMSISLYNFPDLQYLTSLSGISSPLVYVFSPVVGAAAGLLATLLMYVSIKYFRNRVVLLVILVASLIPMGIAVLLELGTQNTINAQNVQAASNATKVLSSRKSIPQTTASVSSSTSATQGIAYKIPVVDGSGKYNDGNISFTYPVSNAEKIGGQSESGWEYDNFPNDYTSLFTGNYATDPKTYNIVSGAELRIIYTHLQEGQYGGSTGPEIRDSVSSIFDTSAYDIKTTDGSYAFGITSSLKNLDNELFGAYFIKNMAEYEIDYNGAPADVSKYKPEFDLIVSSFKFLK